MKQLEVIDARTASTKNTSDLTQMAEAAAATVRPAQTDYAPLEVDSSDNAMLPEFLAPNGAKIPVPGAVEEMPKKDSYFPITIVTGPGQNTPAQPDPEAEKKRRQQIIAFGSVFLLLLVLLIVLIAKNRA